MMNWFIGYSPINETIADVLVNDPVARIQDEDHQVQIVIAFTSC
jgi:hypothetical protein